MCCRGVKTKIPVKLKTQLPLIWLFNDHTAIARFLAKKGSFDSVSQKKRKAIIFSKKPLQYPNADFSTRQIR